MSYRTGLRAYIYSSVVTVLVAALLAGVGLLVAGLSSAPLDRDVIAGSMLIGASLVIGTGIAIWHRLDRLDRAVTQTRESGYAEGLNHRERVDRLVSLSHLTQR